MMIESDAQFPLVPVYLIVPTVQSLHCPLEVKLDDDAWDQEGGSARSALLDCVCEAIIVVGCETMHEDVHMSGREIVREGSPNIYVRSSAGYRL